MKNFYSEEKLNKLLKKQKLWKYWVLFASVLYIIISSLVMVFRTEENHKYLYLIIIIISIFFACFVVASYTILLIPNRKIINLNFKLISALKSTVSGEIVFVNSKQLTINGITFKTITVKQDNIELNLLIEYGININELCDGQMIILETVDSIITSYVLID